jgi:Zinc finger C-x8-C-x5-C-x3-H type (and similar)
MLQSSIHDWDYVKTVTTLIKVNSGLPENDQTVTMAAVSYQRNNNDNASLYKSTSTSARTIKSPKYCYLWNETGTCRFNESCRYNHIRDPNHATVARERKQQRDNDNNKNKSNNRSQPVPKTNRAASDNQSSSKPISNYKGKNPRNQVKMMNSNDENASIKIMNTNSEPDMNSSTSGPILGNVFESP